MTTCPVPDGFFSSPPSTAGSAFFLAAFGILIPVNLYTGMRYKTPLYSSAIIAGLAFEAMGYIGRILLHSDTASSSYFALYTMGVNMGPTCLTAAIFLTLPRIIVLYGSQFTIISQPLYLAVFFLAFGTFALAFEASGSAFAATGVGPAEVSPPRALQPFPTVSAVLLTCIPDGPRGRYPYCRIGYARRKHRNVLRRLLVLCLSPPS